jgi:hypothetical protein
MEGIGSNINNLNANNLKEAKEESKAITKNVIENDYTVYENYICEVKGFVDAKKLEEEYKQKLDKEIEEKKQMEEHQKYLELKAKYETR